MTNFKWSFPALETYPAHAGQTNVVFTIHWRLDGTDEDGTTAGVYGSVAVNYNEGDDFTPFAELTEAKVQEWAEAAIGEQQVADLKVNIENQILALKTPASITMTPPWVTVNEAMPVEELVAA